MTNREAAGPPTLHGAAVAIRDAGVLVRGRSGAGKSQLAEELAAEARARGWFGRLVADDRVRLSARGGRLILSPHPTIAGRVERRGQGIFKVEHEPAIVLRFVVDLVDRSLGLDQPPRYPAASAQSTEIMGILVPRLVAAVDAPGVARAVLEHLEANDS
jgi:HPr kinase/phosphorylase